MDDKQKKQMIQMQKNEITEYHVYNKLAKVCKNKKNSQILKDISEDEKKHYDVLKEYTKQEVKLSKFKLWKYYIISRFFGITFGLKLMENGEKDAQDAYEKFSLSKIKKIAKEEDEHEEKLISILDEERLKYVGSVVLGLNDALVELTGALAGFTLALRDPKLIALTGLITGIAASLSMATSEYLSTKSEENEKHPLKASFYTGGAYFLTVILLIIPFLFISVPTISLLATLSIAVLIIFIFNFYISVAKDLNFKKRFFEMATISLGVAAISYGIGALMRMFFEVGI